MSETLIVKNFGPLKDIKISLNRINIFIGETASGKSILSKLSAIFTSTKLLKSIEKKNFITLLKHYDIDIYLEYNPVIRFESGAYFIEYSNQVLTTNYPNKCDKLYANSFDNVIDYIEELQRYLYDVICSDKKVYHSVGNRWESIKKYIEEVGIQANKNFGVKGINSLINEIDEYQKLCKQEGIFSTQQELELAYKVYEFIEKNIFLATDTIYIPAERAYISTLSNSLFSIIREGITLPKCLTDFGAYFEQARQKLNGHTLKILNVEYRLENNQNIIHLPDYQKELQLTQVSSGMQAVIPMLLVLENIQSKLRIIKNCVVIEEPELNLFPGMQKKLIELIIKKFSDNTITYNASSYVITLEQLGEITQKYINKKDRLIISTHSPYVLTTLDSLIQAKNAFNEKPDATKQISAIVDKDIWIDFESVRAYYLKDGAATDIMDYETKSIGAHQIDDISEEIGQNYDNLLNIMFDEE